MNAEERLQFYLRRIEAEQARKDSLDNSLTLPLYFISLTAAGLGFLTSRLMAQEGARTVFEYLQAITLASSGACLIVALYRFRKAFWGETYSDLALPGEYEQSILEKKEEGLSETLIDIQYDRWVLDQVVQVGADNYEVNARRARSRRSIEKPARYAFLGMVLAWALTIVEWVIPFSHAEPPPGAESEAQ